MIFPTFFSRVEQGKFWRRNDYFRGRLLPGDHSQDAEVRPEDQNFGRVSRLLLPELVKGLFARNTKFMSRDTIRNNPSLVA
jgi:hypothetical protein